MRERVELASKFGINFADGKREVCGDPGYVRAACEASLKRLDVDCIDLYYQHESTPEFRLKSRTQSSNEERGSPQGKISKDSQTTRTEGNLYMPEKFELADTGTSLVFEMDSSFLGKVSALDSSRAHSFQQRSISNEEIDGHVSYHLNLTLASSPLQVDKACYPSSMPQHRVGKASDTRYNCHYKESDVLDLYLRTEIKVMRKPLYLYHKRPQITIQGMLRLPQLK